MGASFRKLNPISAVTLITAVGIGVEFTAHVVLAFLTSLGTRDERMAACMEHMFVPVIHGGLSTLLGIILLAFNEFEFIVIYFFVVMSALVIIGMINGLALFPVLLSLIGPPCEIYPIDGGRTLECPESRSKPTGKMGAALESGFILPDDEKSKNSLQNASSSTETSSNSSEDDHNYHDVLSTIEEEHSSSPAKKELTDDSDASTPPQRF